MSDFYETLSLSPLKFVHALSIRTSQLNQRNRLYAVDANGLRDTMKKLCNENCLKDRESSDHPRKPKLSSENRTASDERAVHMQYEFWRSLRVGNRRFETPLPALVNAFEDADIYVEIVRD
jgi:hypothetical protein